MHRFLVKCCLVGMLLLRCASVLVADDPPEAKADTKAGAKAGAKADGKPDLTEGLMDLLQEPAKRQPAGASDAPKAAGPDRLLDGEDVGQARANPLAEVQLGMNTLAQWLRNQPELSRTKELQRDVVARLDDLIGQLEKQSASPSNSSSSSSPSSSQSSSPSGSGSTSEELRTGQNRSNAPARSQGDASQSDAASLPPERQSQNGQREPSASTGGKSPSGNNGGDPAQPGSNQPGQGSGRSRDFTVDLNDPQALQRSAWGNLPERTREQMQSRMVERFLPAYRDEIEAYYRALVK